jgi:hypothetical protein
MDSLRSLFNCIRIQVHGRGAADEEGASNVIFTISGLRAEEYHCRRCDVQEGLAAIYFKQNP